MCHDTQLGVSQLQSITPLYPPPPPFSGSIHSRLDCSQTPFFSWRSSGSSAYRYGWQSWWYVPRGRASGFRGAREEGTSSQTVPRPLSRFDTHPRWSLVTQSARYRRSYGKIGDCEQSTFTPIHFSQIVVVLYFFTSTDPNGFSVVGTMRSVSTRGSSLGCERDPIGL